MGLESANTTNTEEAMIVNSIQEEDSQFPQQ